MDAFHWILVATLLLKFIEERFPGMPNTSALIQMVEKVSQCRARARITTISRADQPIMNGFTLCVSLAVESVSCRAHSWFWSSFHFHGKRCTGHGIHMGEVIEAKTIQWLWSGCRSTLLASGGFGVHFSSNSSLPQHRRDYNQCQALHW